MWNGNSWYWDTAWFPDLEKQKTTVFLEKMQLVRDRRESHKITGGPGSGRRIDQRHKTGSINISWNQEAAGSEQTQDGYGLPCRGQGSRWVKEPSDTFV